MMTFFMTAQCRQEAERWQRGLPGCARAHSAGRKAGMERAGAWSSFCRLDFAEPLGYAFLPKINGGITPVEDIMAHKKIERKKELDRRRHRRAERLKQRVREAKAAKA